jgi:hypothetical protein
LASGGPYWDHVAFDPEHRLVVSAVPGARTLENTEALVADFRRRTEGRLKNLMTSDDYPADETAILHAYGETVTPPRTGKPGRPEAPYKAPPPGLTYATVTKRREKGRVVEIGTRVVFGTVAAVLAALGVSRGQPGDQHGVRGARERDGPAPRRAEGEEDLSILEGLAVPRGGDLSDALCL